MAWIKSIISIAFGGNANAYDAFIVLALVAGFMVWPLRGRARQWLATALNVALCVTLTVISGAAAGLLR